VAGLHIGDAVQSLSLAMGGWVVPAFVTAVLILAVRAVSSGMHPSILVVGATGAFAFTVCVIALRKHPPGRGMLSAVFLVVFSLLFLLLRLAFAEPLVLPSYFDSIEHYRIIGSLAAQAEGGGPLAWPAPIYYHIGYHTLLAALALLGRLPIASLMLIAGQVVLAFLPAALYAIASRDANSGVAGACAVVFAAFGWYMPSFASNWGKYPALFALPAILFALGMLQLWTATPSIRGNKAPLLLAALGTLAATLVHTRAIVLIVIALVSWAVASWWHRNESGTRLLLAGLLVAALAAAGIAVDRNSTLRSLLDPYLLAGLPATLLAFAFWMAALWRGSRLALAAVLGTGLLLGALFVPVPIGIATTLLDRPLVEIVLFAPIALGASGGVVALQDRLGLASPAWRSVAVVILGLLLAAHSIFSYGLAPSKCCVLAGEDDLVAMSWIAGHVALDARIGIAQQSASFLPSPLSPLEAFSDGGGWIVPLTGRKTTPFPAATSFADPQSYSSLCSSRVNYLYVGTGLAHFDINGLGQNPRWYSLVLQLPGARIYAVRDCPP
jgi:hypothetical protein